jgi:exonuclease VII small subunit
MTKEERIYRLECIVDVLENKLKKLEEDFNDLVNGRYFWKQPQKRTIQR